MFAPDTFMHGRYEARTDCNESTNYHYRGFRQRSKNKVLLYVADPSENMCEFVFDLVGLHFWLAQDVCNLTLQFSVTVDSV